MKMDESLLGKCGFYCGQCQSFLTGQCIGCLNENQEGMCYTRDCTMKKGLLSCGFCKDFPCEHIQKEPKATLLSPLWLKWKASQKKDFRDDE